MTSIYNPEPIDSPIEQLVPIPSSTTPPEMLMYLKSEFAVCLLDNLRLSTRKHRLFWLPLSARVTKSNITVFLGSKADNTIPNPNELRIIEHGKCFASVSTSTIIPLDFANEDSSRAKPDNTTTAALHVYLEYLWN